MMMKNPWQIFISLISVFCVLFANMGAYKKQEEKTIFIGHRGFSSQYLENTEESFYKAAEVGFDGCETDVKITSDGFLILAHDVKFTYDDDTELTVEDHTFAELTAKPLKNEFTDSVLYPCTFRRYIEIMSECNLFAFIELKGEYPDEKLQEIVETVESLYTWDKCSIQSMEMENLIKLRERYPDIPLMFCGGGYSDDAKEALARSFDVDLKINDVLPSFIRRCKRKGVRTALWTANDNKDVALALSLGVDFIESDCLWGYNVAEGMDRPIFTK